MGLLPCAQPPTPNPPRCRGLGLLLLPALAGLERDWKPIHFNTCPEILRSLADCSVAVVQSVQENQGLKSSLKYPGFDSFSSPFRNISVHAILISKRLRYSYSISRRNTFRTKDISIALDIWSNHIDLYIMFESVSATSSPLSGSFFTVCLVSEGLRTRQSLATLNATPGILISNPIAVCCRFSRGRAQAQAQAGGCYSATRTRTPA